MTTTELDDVTSLLGKVLPDPRGFAQRVFEQLAARWSNSAHFNSAATEFNDAKDAQPTAAMTSSTANDIPEDLSDPHTLLAAALGACECWGFRFDCTVCDGAGFSGWRQPDPTLFHEFVAPAVERLSASAPAEYAHSGGAPRNP
jgi:hypothetical protein